MLDKRKRFNRQEFAHRYREIRTTGILFVTIVVLTLIGLISISAETWTQWLIGLFLFAVPTPVFFAAWLSRIRSALLDLERELPEEEGAGDST